jgi:hypothetical protein
MDNLYFRVADACFHIEFIDEEDNRNLLPSFPAFHLKEVPSEPLMFSLRVGKSLCNIAPEGEEVGQFDCGGANHGIYKLPSGGYAMHISSPEGTLSCILNTNAEFTECQATLVGDKEARKFGLNNAIMICFAFSGAYHDILLIHASVPMIDDKAYLFLGKSGTGKSTHCNLWLENFEKADLLNDDNPAIRVHSDGNIYVYGTPWSGKTPCYRALRRLAGGFLRLEQAPFNEIGRLHPVKALASVLSSCSTMVWDPSYKKICDTVTQVVSRIPVFYLKNLPNNEAAQMSYSALRPEDENN